MSIPILEKTQNIENKQLEILKKLSKLKFIKNWMLKILSRFTSLLVKNIFKRFQQIPGSSKTFHKI